MKEELHDFGLTENEIKTYLVLLKLGNANPSEIAEKTGFSRPYVYDILERLLEKSIVSFVLKKNKKYYSAIEPSLLEELAKQRLDNIKKIVPDLEKIKKSIDEEIKVELHKGEWVFKMLLNDVLSILKKNDEVLIYGIDELSIFKLNKFMPMYLDQYFHRIIKMKTKERVIIAEGGKRFPEATTTKYKTLPKEIIGNTSFFLYANKVAIFLWGIPNYLILIENKRVADSYRNQFEMLWKAAKA
ncbi:MAG: helix-turn-helix domain-containing protein [archaeon]